MNLVTVADVTHANLASAPKGMQLALYSTGSGGIAATAAELAAHPDAVIIDQTPAAGRWDNVADVDDYERGAVSLAELAPRAKARMAAFKAVTHPGQREPAVYMSESNVTSVVNALIKGGVTSGVGLWVADWSWTLPEAIAKVTAAAGPFPIVGVQYHNAGAYDLSVFSGSWLANRSKRPVPVTVKPHVPPGQWLDAHAWTWQSAAIAGVGLDHKNHVWSYVPGKGTWVQQSLPVRYHGLLCPVWSS